MRRILTGSGCLLFLTILLSCSKGSNDPAKEQSPKEILMAARWKKSEYRENGVVMPFFGACESDDVLSFTATNWVMDDGADNCGYSTGTDFYVIESDNKTMRWSYGAGELSFNSTRTAFTFKRTGANTFEYSFVKK